MPGITSPTSPQDSGQIGAQEFQMHCEFLGKGGGRRFKLLGIESLPMVMTIAMMMMMRMMVMVLMLGGHTAKLLIYLGHAQDK